MRKLTTGIAALLITTALLAVAGCDKKAECETCRPIGYTEDERMIAAAGKNPVYIQLNIPQRTKSDDIESIDLFVFESGQGDLETWRHFSSITQMSQSALAVGNGMRTFVVLVNAIEDFSCVGNLTDLIAMKIDSRDSSLDSRYWCVEKIEISGPVHLTFQVGLYRALINIHSIKVDFNDNILNKYEISDVKAAVLDVPSRVSLTGESDIQDRFNCGEIMYGDYYREIGTLKHGEIMDCNTSFKVAPKCDGIDEEGNRAVRAAIYGFFNGKRMWWTIPVNMGLSYDQIYGTAGICSNTEYDLDITITGVGTDGPYDRTALSNLDIICTVQEWYEQSYSVVF